MAGKRSLLLVLAATALAWPPAAGAAVTIGSDLGSAPSGFINCSFVPNCTAVTTQHPVNPIVSPINGVIVRWRTRFGDTFDGAKLRVLQVSGGNLITGIRSGPPTHVPAGLQELSINPGMSISSGDLIGVDVASDSTAMVIGPRPTASLLWRSSGVADGAVGLGAPLANSELLINADVEADVDCDLLGDESQDPQVAGGCLPLPETKLIKQPKRLVKTAKRRAKLRFSFSTSPTGASFQCKLDRHGFRFCSAPKRIAVKATRSTRKHKFQVRAIDAAGRPDPTPAVDRFKVKRVG